MDKTPVLQTKKMQEQIAASLALQLIGQELRLLLAKQVKQNKEK